MVGIPLEVHYPNKEDPEREGVGATCPMPLGYGVCWEGNHREEPILQVLGCAGASQAGPELSSVTSA